MALAHMCHLFGFMKEWLQEGSVSTSDDMADLDTRVRKEWIFSEDDCAWYTIGINGNGSLCYESTFWFFIRCITTHS